MTLQVGQIVPVVKLYFNERNHSLPFAVGGSRMGVRGMDKQSKIELILALALSAPLLESRPWFWAAKPAAQDDVETLGETCDLPAKYGPISKT